MGDNRHQVLRIHRLGLDPRARAFIKARTHEGFWIHGRRPLPALDCFNSIRGIAIGSLLADGDRQTLACLQLQSQRIVARMVQTIAEQAGKPIPQMVEVDDPLDPLAADFILDAPADENAGDDAPDR